MHDNLAVIDYEKCDNCGICVEACPTNSIADLSKEREQVPVEA
jgi:Pyruvate/2-oxoacid:ferredoxin oxidoreductase delta subunit